MITILNTDKHLKAAIAADKLVWQGITFRFEKVGVQFTVSVNEKDVRTALEACEMLQTHRYAH